MKTRAHQRRGGMDRRRGAWGVAVLTALAAVVGGGTSPVRGQEADEGGDQELASLDLLDMEVPTVVTASRHEQKITSVPYAVSVITAEDIRQSGARNIPDALRLVPGVDVAELSYGQTAVSPRGFHGLLGRQVLVLVDGRQIYDSMFGGTIWGGWPISLKDVERIEVIRGPGGVTWGANAVNGVINIVSREPGTEPGVSLSLGGASRGGVQEYAGYDFTKDKLSLRLSQEFESSDGFLSAGSIFGPPDDDYRAGRGVVSGLYRSSDRDTVSFSMGSALVDGGAARTPLAGIGEKRNAGSQANYLLLNWRHEVEADNVLELKTYANDFQLSPGVPAIDYRYQQIAFQLSQTRKLGEAHTMMWGFDTRTDLLDASNSDPQLLSDDHVNSVIAGLYVQDEWSFAPKWTLTMGGRVDYESYGGFEPSARLALTRQLDERSMVYAAASRAFQMPPPGVRFVELPVLNQLAWVTGREDVDAEGLLAYETGYRTRLAERMDTGVNVYLHDYADLTTISPSLGGPGLMQLGLDNRADALAYGIEWDARYAATKRLTLLAHYTYQHMSWDADVPYHDKDLMSPPQHKAMIGTRYDATDDLHLSGHLYYVDAVRSSGPSAPFWTTGIDPYLRLDLRAEQEFWKDTASLAVGVRNLLDDGHPEGTTLFGADTEVPRMVFAEFRVSIR